MKEELVPDYNLPHTSTTVLHIMYDKGCLHSIDVTVGVNFNVYGDFS